MPLRSPAAKPALPEDLKGAVQALSDGTLAARAYCESRLARIRVSEAGLRAWIALDDERALTLAAARDAERARGGHTGALHGVPVGVKDVFDTDDLPTEMGSPAFVGNQPGKNAAIVERILAAGGYALGKTATTEFAFMHPAETRNPWNARHTPGGSSSGSAATLDHVGVFARTVADAAYFAASLAESGKFAPEIETLSRPPKIAVLHRFPWNAAEPDAARYLQASLKRLADAGTELKAVTLPDDFDEAHRVHRTIMYYEGAREHAPRQALHRRVMSAVLNAAIDEGLAISHDDYRGALSKRAVLAELALDLFESCDALASLPAPGAAPARLDATGDPSFCTLWTLIGFPALTIPTGLSDGGLPYGMQLAGPAGGDDRLLRVASWCEAVIGFKGSPR